MGALQLNICVGGALLGGTSQTKKQALKDDDEEALLLPEDSDPVLSYGLETEGGQGQIIRSARTSESETNPFFTKTEPNGSSIESTLNGPEIESKLNGTRINDLESPGNNSKLHRAHEGLKGIWKEIKALCSVGLILFMICMVLLATVLFASMLFLDKLGGYDMT